MKKLLLSAVALMTLCSQAYEFSFKDSEIKFHEENMSYSIRSKNNPGGIWGAFRIRGTKEDAALVKAENSGDGVIIDTREYFKKYPTGKNILISWYGLKADDYFTSAKENKTPEKVNRMECHVSSEPGMRLVSVILSSKGKAFWTSKPHIFIKKDEAFVFESPLPLGVDGVYLRTDLHSGGIYKFKKIRFFAYKPQKNAEEKFDPSVNYIRNGGAEDGFANVFSNSLKFAQSAVTGKFIDYRNKEINSQNVITIDSANAHTGRYSFKVEKTTDYSYGRLSFNPVPYKGGKPTSFTVWMKADRPMTVNMGLYPASGYAIVSHQRLTTEWKKYEIFAPSYGKPGAGFQIIGGDIVNGYAKDTKVVIPYVYPEDKQKGTFWVDTASYTIGGHSAFKDTGAIHLRSRIDRNNGYYYAGETVKTSVEAENYTNKPLTATVQYAITDWSGKKVTESRPQEITLDKNGKKTLTFDIVPPKKLRGALNLTYFVKADGKTAESTQYFGIIEKNQTLQYRTGLEFPGNQNVKLAMPYLQDFRIGIVRVGGASGKLDYSFHNLPILKENGIKTLFCVSMFLGLRRDPVVKQDKWDAWMKYFEENVKKYAGLVEIWESENEANITGWNTDNNLEHIRQLGAIIRKNDPGAKFAGPTTCSVDYTWIENVLRKGGKDILDYVSYHPYRIEPELPDHAEDARRLKQLVHTYAKLPQIATESGIIRPPSMPDNKINDYIRTTSAQNIRNILLGFAGGTERYYHFAFTSTVAASTWTVLFAGNPGTENTPVPNPTFFAIRNLIDRIENAPYAGRVKFGLSYRGLIFDHGNKRTAVIWKWRGEPSVLSLPESGIKAYDFMGTEIDPHKITLTPCPVYLDSNKSVKDLIARLENASLTDSSGNSITIENVVIGNKRFELKIQNITGRPVDCKITVLTPGVINGTAVKNITAIQGENSKKTTFDLQKKLSTTPVKIKVLAEIPAHKEKQEKEITLRGIIARKVAEPLKIDGDLSDWPANTAVIRLDSRNTDKRDHRNWGEKENRIKANLRYAWDDNYLYISAEVFKPELYPHQSESSANKMFQYDSIQVCFDTIRNARETDFIQDDDFEYTLGLIGKKARVFRRWASAASYDSLAKEPGILNYSEVPVAVRKYADRTVYEAAFSRRAVSPFRLEKNACMRVGTLININNGKERVGYLELTPGVGYAKHPAEWMDLVLLP